MKNKSLQEKIDKTKKIINELQKTQEDHFDELIKSLKLDETEQEKVFDYIFNSQEEPQLFENFISIEPEIITSLDIDLNGLETQVPFHQFDHQEFSALILPDQEIEICISSTASDN